MTGIKKDEDIRQFLQGYGGRAFQDDGGVWWVYNPNSYLSPAWRHLRINIYPARFPLVNGCRTTKLESDPLSPDARIFGARVADRLVPVAQTLSLFHGMTLDDCDRYTERVNEVAHA